MKNTMVPEESLREIEVIFYIKVENNQNEKRLLKLCRLIEKVAELCYAGSVLRQEAACFSALPQQCRGQLLKAGRAESTVLHTYGTLFPHNTVFRCCRTEAPCPCRLGVRMNIETSCHGLLAQRCVFPYHFLHKNVPR